MCPEVDEESILRALRDGAHDCVDGGRESYRTYPAVALSAIARSETARESSELAQAVIRSQKQWMSIIDAITDFIFVLDGNQGIVQVNNAFASTIGNHPRTLIGKKIRDVFALDIPNETFLQEILRDGVPRTYEKKSGDEIYQISIFPLQEKDRSFTIHVMKNVTAERRLKDQLYYSDKLASIGLLVSGVAHEINNPLTGTIAYTELLAMKVKDEDVKADLKKILDSAERCKKIVDNLMTFSRQRKTSRSLESINDIIDRAIDLQSYWLKAHHIEIVRDYDSASTVFVDAQQIQQVILNLIVNAEQAIMDAGQLNGRITLATKFNKDTKRVVITVIDNGPGIPQKIAAKIFDPFFTTKPVGIGTGLGLSIAHGIITEHGGTIRLETGEGGAAFTIELPTGSGSVQ
jgi:PAS domain S-box-containing protein